MLPAVDFYSKIVTVNIKINDVVPDVLLPVHGEWQTFQEKVPKLSFRIGHVVAEIFCKGTSCLLW